MFCVICGTANLEAGIFCRHCGKPLVKDSDLSRSTSSDGPKPEIDIKRAVSLTVPGSCQRQVRTDGNKLFVPTGASFPPYCVKCGKSDVKMVTQTLSWLSPVYYAFLLLGLGIVLVYFIFRKTVKLEIPLCPFHAQRVRRLKMAAIVSLVGFIPVGALVGNLVPEPDGAAWGLGTGIVMLLAGLAAAYLQSPLQAAGIDRERALLQGAGVAFLAKVSGS